MFVICGRPANKNQDYPGYVNYTCALLTFWPTICTSNTYTLGCDKPDIISVVTITIRLDKCHS